MLCLDENTRIQVSQPNSLAKKMIQLFRTWGRKVGRGWVGWEELGYSSVNPISAPKSEVFNFNKKVMM